MGGAGVVVLPLLLMGMVMASASPDLASAPDPVSFLGEILPLWLAVPYPLIALAGTLLINSMSMYSVISGLLYTVMPKPAVVEPAGRRTERVDAAI